MFARKIRKLDLQKVVAALAGHKFEGSDVVALSAWRLSPGAWVYVARRVDKHEEGWRRRRGMAILNRIARVRRDLAPPIAVISCSLCWTGTFEARRIVLQALRNIIRCWRESGKWLPILGHAKVFFTWKPTQSLRTSLCNPSDLMAALREPKRAVCRCAALLADNPCWPSVFHNGERHIAASQGSVPWPVGLKHFAFWAASISLPPRRKDLMGPLQSSVRRLAKWCRVSDTCASERVLVECVDSLWADLTSRAADAPISWNDVKAAKRWLQGFFVQYFDHNASRLGEHGSPRINCADISMEQISETSSATRTQKRQSSSRGTIPRHHAARRQCAQLLDRL